MTLTLECSMRRDNRLWLVTGADKAAALGGNCGPATHRRCRARCARLGVVFTEFSGGRRIA